MDSIQLDVPEPGQLNLAALMIYQQTQKNLIRPERARMINDKDFTIQFQASRMFFAISKQGKTIRIRNGRVSRPDATLKLMRIRFWGSSIIPLLLRRIHFQGNIFKLFRLLLFLKP